jgi:hypothetical protein
VEKEMWNNKVLDANVKHLQRFVKSGWHSRFLAKTLKTPPSTLADELAIFSNLRKTCL